jgi:AcrR family transcriptional regulator
MPRTIKDPNVRRDEILDVTQQFIYTKGYEQMTIQDILDQLSISKGAFYHYFNSKQALLEALITRMEEQGLAVLQPIMDDPSLSAVEKFNRYFDTAARWKTTRKDYLMAILKIWYADENALVRQKLMSGGMDLLVPHLAKMVRQGVNEGVFHVDYPDQTAAIVFFVMESLSDGFSALLLDAVHQKDVIQNLETMTAACTDAVERVLGAEPGSLHLMDVDILREWVIPSTNAALYEAAEVHAGI